MLSKQLSIALVVGSVSRSAGGMFESVRKRALGYVDAGHRVEVFGLLDKHTRSDIEAWAPLKPVVSPALFRSEVGYSPGLTAKLMRGHFDVIHQHGIWQAFSASVSRAAQRRRIPVMISPHGMLDPWAVRHSNWKKQLAKAVYERTNLHRSACMHALNVQEARAIEAYGIAKPIAVIPNGTDLAPNMPRPAPPGWWPTGSVLLFLGRIHPKKGIKELIRAFALLKALSAETAKSWTIVIAGWDDGGHLNDARALAQQLGVADQVRFPGPQFGVDKDAVIANSDAFILPSYSEGLPMAVLEAWSWNVPVLMTQACNLTDGFSALAAFEIDTDPERMCASLSQILSLEPERLRAVGRNGRALVERRYLWSQVVREHIEVYRWMASDAGVSSSTLAAGVAERRQPECIR